MAADTANKRYSAMHMGCPWRSALPLPDGSVNSGDRAVMLLLYAGIATGATPVGGGWAEMVFCYVPGAQQVQSYVPGAENTFSFVPGAEEVEAS